MASDESPLPLADRLRQAITDKGISQRELARRIAGPNAEPKRVESERRQLGKYLAGQHAPTPERAGLLAEILEKPSDYFIDPDDGRTRLVDQMRAVVTLLEGLRVVVEERWPEEDAESAADLRLLARRLQSLEAKVDAQGEATTKALKALTAGIRKLERQLTPAAREANQEEAAR